MESGTNTPMEVTKQYPFDDLIQCDYCKDGPSSQPSGGRRWLFGLYQYQNHSDFKKHLKKSHCNNVILIFKCRICDRVENDLKKQKRHYRSHGNTEDVDTIHNELEESNYSTAQQDIPVEEAPVDTGTQENHPIIPAEEGPSCLTIERTTSNEAEVPTSIPEEERMSERRTANRQINQKHPTTTA